MPKLARSARRTAAASISAAALLAGLTACGSDDSKATDTPAASGSETAISAERCEANKAAGKITYMSGYYWQASASILEVIAAEKLGYFSDLCLDVDMQSGSGDTTQNAKLLASGKVSITALSEQDVITSNANGVEVTGISSYSNSGLDVLMTGTDITDLTQLEGKTVGHKGYMPMGLGAMLTSAGLDLAKTTQVKVGYDPTVLPRGQVDALTGFASNEPNTLTKAGEEVTVWSPADFDVPSSLGAFAVNPEFAAANPTAVEDFLRASFKAFQYCGEEANVDECIGYQGEIAGATADAAHESSVWTTEFKIAAENPLPGKFGSIDATNVSAMTELVKEVMGLDVTPEKTAGWFDNSFTDAVVDADGSVIWPAP